MILVSGVSVYATYKYFANEVVYTKADGTEISVEEALNDLYSNTFSKMTYYTSITAGRNESYTSQSPSVNFDFTLPEGNYIIFAVRSCDNSIARDFERDASTNFFSLTGCDSVEILDYEEYGVYRGYSQYIVQFTNVYYCKVENQKNLTGSMNAGYNDVTVLLQVFKLER